MEGERKGGRKEREGDKSKEERTERVRMEGEKEKSREDGIVEGREGGRREVRNTDLL